MAFELTRDMIVVENDDLRVSYSHGWERVPGEPGFCTGGSVHRSYTKGATARFEFEGSHIWLIGHKGAAHGTIGVNFDGHPEIATINARRDARAPAPFQKLFEHKFETSGPHWIEVMNDLSGSEITIDAFAYRPMAPGRTWKPPQGLKLVTIADNDPRITYSGNWEHRIENMNQSHVGGGSYHITYTRGAMASTAIEGTQFWIIRDLHRNHGNYSVSVNGGPPEQFSGHVTEWRKFIVMYERRFSHPGPHHIVIRNEDDKAFGLDAIIYEAPVSLRSVALTGHIPNSENRPGSQAEDAT